MQNLFYAFTFVFACLLTSVSYGQTYTISESGKFFVHGSFNDDGTLRSEVVINVPNGDDIDVDWGSNWSVYVKTPVGQGHNCARDAQRKVSGNSVRLRSDFNALHSGVDEAHIAECKHGTSGIVEGATGNGFSILVLWRNKDRNLSGTGSHLVSATVVITDRLDPVPGSTPAANPNPVPVPHGTNVPSVIAAPSGFRMPPDSNGVTAIWDADAGVDEFRFVLYEGSPTQRKFPAVISWRSAGGGLVGGVYTPNTSINFSDNYREFLSGNTDYTMQLQSMTGGVKSNTAQLGFMSPGDIPYSRVATPVSTESDELPVAVSLSQNYPNPFNPLTSISYVVPAPGHVRLTIYDMRGQEIGILVDGYMPAGEHTTQFEASTIPSGTYAYRLDTQEGTLIRTMTLIK